MMISMDDPEHQRRRSLVTRGFTPRRVAAHEPFVRELCREIINRVCEKGSCDFVWDLAAPLPLYVIADLLGYEPAMYDDLLRWSEAMMTPNAEDMLTPDQIADLMQRANTTMDEFREAQLGIIADRRRNPRDDVMTVLCQAEIDGERLDDESIVQEMLLILIGGDETTRHVLSGGMLELIKHRDQLDALRSGDAELALAAEEMIRWNSPVQNMGRTAMRDVTIRDQQIKKGEQLMLFYPSANRDEDVFDGPAPVRRPAQSEPAPGVRLRDPLLPRCLAGPSRGSGHVRRAAPPDSRHRARHRQAVAPPQLQLRKRPRDAPYHVHADGSGGLSGGGRADDRPLAARSAEIEAGLDRARAHRHDRVSLTDLRAPDSGMANDTVLFTLDGEPLVARLGAGARIAICHVSQIRPRVPAACHRTRSGVDGRSGPQIVHLERSDQWLGAPFLIGAAVDGEVPSDNPPYLIDPNGWFLQGTTEQWRRFERSTIDVLVQLHRVVDEGDETAFLHWEAPGATALERQLNAHRAYYEWAHDGHTVPILRAHDREAGGNAAGQRPQRPELG